MFVDRARERDGGSLSGVLLNIASGRISRVKEQTALRSFLRLRWSVGLTQDAAGLLERDACQFDADSWLCGVSSAGEDIAPYIELWRQEGATKTIAYVAAFLEMNPDLIRLCQTGQLLLAR